MSAKDKKVKTEKEDVEVKKEEAEVKKEQVEEEEEEPKEAMEENRNWTAFPISQLVQAMLIRGRYADFQDIVEDVGNTAARSQDTSLDVLTREMEGLSLCPRSWDAKGKWLYIFEYNNNLKQWLPVFVQTTTMTLTKRLSLLLSNSFRPSQPQYKTHFSAFIRESVPEKWRIRIIPQCHWIDDNDNQLSLDDAMKFFVLKYHTYASPENPIGCNDKYSPVSSPSQKEKARTIASSPCFTSPDTPSKRGSSTPVKAEVKKE